ncbi:hypothetical protein VSDG_07358 [Cytospora chrysosperma]|uniref:Phospholipase/carboxylesterase/thioesterase domain-containing protein n=1 Tax=Cytospora chrysosperma TaxID=252740 RepID=A0A423VQB0_CYTCH|nr:hypothetical protein VSDG_07358 [Valsa sordida]
MPVEASFPEPLVVVPLSGIHKHTIILLHGRGGSANTFGQSLLNTPIPATSTGFSGLDEGGQTVGDGNNQAVTTPNLVCVPVIDSTIAESRYPTLPSLGVTPNDITIVGAHWSAKDALRNTTCHHGAPHRQRGISTTLAEALPHAKFVFPNAPKQRATVYKRSVMRQWFDDWHLRPELSGDLVNHWYDEGLQISGLGKTVRYLHDLVAQEADLVGGVQNVVLGGISQGCAASLIAALLWEGDDRLGAVVGMCGWLPYLTQMQEVMQAQGDSAGKTGEAGDDFELFERPTSPLASPSVAGSADAALGWLRDELELPRIQSSGSLRVGSRNIPVFLGHGWNDDKVDRDRGQAAGEFLLSLGMEVRQWKVYGGVGHEYSEEMLVDILSFLESVLQASS